MTDSMTWESVLKRGDFIGRDVEIHDTDCIYRGPVKNIIKVKKSRGWWIQINLLWTARRPVGVDKGSSSWPISAFLANYKIRPIDIGNGHVSFSRWPILGFGIFHPDCNRLDPDKVKGLKI